MLRQLPDYLENAGRTKEIDKPVDPIDIEAKETPEESLANTYLKIRKNLVLNLLLKVKQCSPAFFENLVVKLLVKMDYGGTIKEAGKATRLTNDGGIDGIIKEDRPGLDFSYTSEKMGYSICRQTRYPIVCRRFRWSTCFERCIYYDIQVC